ncbi:uncharacterized protein DNG_03798 [Cephalotrichum gorgonifer]|uniref:2EXR domain-containing protein n=1 Tax=Cephalotrichum gorgonifer TaxID=2041049 RepID=A0AAE8STZ0_9PEZI|nr:uncharacterized protein DNG_03798 [Cephalotrichum gorgonifer]
MAHLRNFSKLPLELRLAIWNLSIRRPRLVPIHLYATSPSEEPAENSQPQCVSPCPAPASLYVCRESRTEALKHHRLSFGMYRSQGRIFFDSDSDVLYFGRREGIGASGAQFCTAMTLCAPEDLARVKRLAINESVFKVGCKYVHSLATDVLSHLCARMPELEELVFVPEEEILPDTADDCGHESELTNMNFTLKMMGMGSQMRAVMRDFCERHPEWKPPRCRVMTLQRGWGGLDEQGISVSI